MSQLVSGRRNRLIAFAAVVFVQVLLVFSLALHLYVAKRAATRIVLPAVKVARPKGMPRDEGLLTFRPTFSYIDSRKVPHSGPAVPEGTETFFDLERRDGRWQVVYYHTALNDRKTGTTLLMGLAAPLPLTRAEEKNMQFAKTEWKPGPVFRVDFGFGRFYAPLPARSIPKEGLELEAYIDENGRPVASDLLVDGRSLGLKASYGPLGSNLE